MKVEVAEAFTLCGRKKKAMQLKRHCQEERKFDVYGLWFFVYSWKTGDD